MSGKDGRVSDGQKEGRRKGRSYESLRMPRHAKGREVNFSQDRSSFRGPNRFHLCAKRQVTHVTSRAKCET